MMTHQRVAIVLAGGAVCLLACGNGEDRLPPPNLNGLASSSSSSGAGGQGGAAPEVELCGCIAQQSEPACNTCFVDAQQPECSDETEQCNVSPGCRAVFECLQETDYAASAIDTCLLDAGGPNVLAVFVKLMECTCGRCSDVCESPAPVACMADDGGGGGAGGAGGGSGGSGGGSGGSGGAGGG